MADAEAKSMAHLLALEAMQSYHWADPAIEVVHELNRIMADHRRKACLAVGDRVLARQLERELGHQVKPTGKKARAIERLVRKTEKD